MINNRIINVIALDLFFILGVCVINLINIFALGHIGILSSIGISFSTLIVPVSLTITIRIKPTLLTKWKISRTLLYAIQLIIFIGTILFFKSSNLPVKHSITFFFQLSSNLAFPIAYIHLITKFLKAEIIYAHLVCNKSCYFSQISEDLETLFKKYKIRITLIQDEKHLNLSNSMNNLDNIIYLLTSNKDIEYLRLKYSSQQLLVGYILVDLINDRELRLKYLVNKLKIHYFLKCKPNFLINRILKRSLDLGISLLALITILPVSLVIVFIYHRLQSRGELFFRQSRIGKNGRSFKIFKYRSMHKNKQEITQACREDQRVFAFGKTMRKFSIDEVPQFLNVLKGEMSFIGPRPFLAKHCDEWAKLDDNFFLRKLVKPGITGLAQIKGFRGELSVDNTINQRTFYDIKYISEFSLLMDALIGLSTVKQVIKPSPYAY